MKRQARFKHPTDHDSDAAVAIILKFKDIADGIVCGPAEFIPQFARSTSEYQVNLTKPPVV